MITLTATWTEWKAGDKIVKPTPGRDRPIVVTCSTPFTAAILTGVLTRLGCDVTREVTA
jgi:rhodanese-related sulfurtransferase